MASQKKERFVNLYFTRFIEQAISNVHTDYLPFLNAQDRINITRRRTFLKEGLLEEKLFLLAKIGHPFVIMIGSKDKEHGLKKIWQLLRIFLNKKYFDKRKAVRELKDAGAFVLTDVDFVKAMQLAGNIYNSPMYNLVTSYKGLTDKIFQYQRDATNASAEISAAMEIDTLIRKAILLGMRAVNQAEFFALYKITYREYMVLSVLSSRRQMKFGDLNKLYGKQISHDLQALRIKNMVNNRRQTSESGKDDTSEYWISAFGETVLIEARKYFIKHITG